MFAFIPEINERSRRETPCCLQQLHQRSLHCPPSRGAINGVWTDIALEQTYNKEGKTSLVKGILQNPGAREKYVMSAPFLSHVSESVKAMAQLENKHTSSHHRGASCSQAREEQTLEETEKMVNPFTTTNHSYLLNIASGEKAPLNDVIDARELGLEAMKRTRVLCFFRTSEEHKREDSLSDIAV